MIIMLPGLRLSSRRDSLVRYSSSSSPLTGYERPRAGGDEYLRRPVSLAATGGYTAALRNS
jgi:hypothetical protein